MNYYLLYTTRVGRSAGKTKHNKKEAKNPTLASSALDKF